MRQPIGVISAHELVTPLIVGRMLTDDLGFISVRKQGFDLLLGRSQRPHEALRVLRGWEASVGLDSPKIYVSTAITSGGFRRDAARDFQSAKTANERAASLLIGALLGTGLLVSSTNCMIPTELGAVPGWSDSDYLQFYFAYACGLSDTAAQSLDLAASKLLPSASLDLANNRALTNVERWPYYEALTRGILEALDEILSKSKSVGHAPFNVLLQLADTDWSLGCRAELLFAEHFSLDVIWAAIDVPALDPGAALRQKLEALKRLNATFGSPGGPVLPVPGRLNALIGES